MIFMLLYTNSFPVFIDSAILSNDHHYLNHLHLFLAPEVGHSSQWLLCYRQSSHGDLDTTFHRNCDGKEKTVTIVQEKEFVFGGYTDIPWGNCNCFIFSKVSVADTSCLHLHCNLPVWPVFISVCFYCLFCLSCLTVCLPVCLCVCLSALYVCVCVCVCVSGFRCHTQPKYSLSLICSMTVEICNSCQN